MMANQIFIEIICIGISAGFGGFATEILSGSRGLGLCIFISIMLCAFGICLIVNRS